MRYRVPEVRTVPDNAITVEHPEGLGVAYVSRWTGDKYAVKAYRGKAGKPSFYTIYRTLDRAHEAIESWFDGLTQHKQIVKDRRHSSYEPHTFKVGDIVTNSWGYDQTNVDWYRVARTTEHFVWLQPICGHTKETGFMSGPSVPHIDTSSDDPTKWGFADTKEPLEKHRATGNNVCMKYGSGSKWDGKERYCSWYA